MCNSYSESGKPCGFYGCESYKLLRAALTTAQLKCGEMEIELSACAESPGGCGYWREAAKLREQERGALRRALDLLGVPAQALKEPDKAPPLRVSVALAKRAMEIINDHN